MTLSTAERLEQALSKLHDAETREEKEAAATEFVRAEREHFHKLGIDTRGQSWAVRLFPLALIVIMLVSAYLAIGNAADVKELSETNRESNFATCERGNESRPVTVANLEGDIVKLQADVRDLKAELQLINDVPGPVGELVRQRKRNAIDAAQAAIKGKEASIQGLIAAQAPVAIEPGSLIVDCLKVVDDAHAPAVPSSD